MRFGGVDPSIIRELSGIYKPFPKAFKELLSNAFDADAQRVAIAVIPDERRITIQDDGTGMTPFEFHRDFTKIGGSEKARSSATTALGRTRIGCKGIGFLAVARYCDRMIVKTHGPRIHREKLKVSGSKANILDRLRIELPKAQAAGRIKVRGIKRDSNSKELKASKDFSFDPKTAILSFLGKKLADDNFTVDIEVDCRGLELTATLDFKELLEKAYTSDLYDLDTFCTTKFQHTSTSAGYTRIALEGLREEVVSELTREQRGTNIKSIELRSGRDQFQWYLERIIPLPYPTTPWVERGGLVEAQRSGKLHHFPEVRLTWAGSEPQSLGRRIYAADPKDLEGTAFSIVPVAIKEAGLEVCGYILATSQVISPAEYRGITVRVRNVSIGDSHFFGLERTLTGAQRAALQQITGEIVILKGLDTPDALNPGRESFYEENPQAKRLRELLAGKSPVLGGLLKTAVQKVLEHSQLAGRARNYLGQAQRRRRALLECAGAINRYCYEGYRDVFAKFFAATSAPKLALKDAPTISLKPPTRLHDFSIQQREGIGSDFVIDQENKVIHFDYKQEVWDQELFVSDHHFQVEAKKGTARDPLCEIDAASKSIYVNWSHPLKQTADEAQYLKVAILWTMAFELFEKPQDVMQLGLALLTHQEG